MRPVSPTYRLLGRLAWFCRSKYNNVKQYNMRKHGPIPKNDNCIMQMQRRLLLLFASTCTTPYNKPRLLTFSTISIFINENAKFGILNCFTNHIRTLLAMISKISFWILGDIYLVFCEAFFKISLTTLSI